MKKAFIITAGLILAGIVCCMVFFSGNSDTVKRVSNNEKEIKLPIIMYHGILNDTKYQGTYVIAPSQFESDLKKIQSDSYTTVTVHDIVEYVYNNRPLPPKPIMLTFDDGYYNNYLYAYPLLKKYGCKAVISPIASCSEYFSDTDDFYIYHNQKSGAHGKPYAPKMFTQAFLALM